MIEYLALAWLAYVIGVASPGPATLLIAVTSMGRGRATGVATAGGVMLGSLFWGVLAGLGLAAVLSAAGWLGSTIRVAGGCYLLYLCFRSLQAAWRNDPAAVPVAGSTPSLRASFLRGLLLHLTNPKAVLAWGATVSVGMPVDAPVWFGLVVVASCWLIGIAIFGGYALLFASPKAQTIYRSAKRVIDAAAAVVFGAAGLLVDDRPVGMASYMREDAANGVVEIGAIAHSGALARTAAATEAHYLQMGHAFALGYRRYEWKCDDANEASKRAARRLGLL